MFLPEIDKSSATPLNRQLYRVLRKAIMTGLLSSGTRLPSSRNLAQDLQISRNVVLEAYDQLIAEGFLQTRAGAGTFVARGAMFKEKDQTPKPDVAAINMGYDGPHGIINFRAGTPQLQLFPSSLWLKMVRQVLSVPAEKILNYGDPEGHPELRQAVCDYVIHQREVKCHPDQVLITCGTTQAISICCSLLLTKYQDVIIEDPITRDIQLITINHGAKLHPLPVDNQGMQTELLPGKINPAFIYVTPSHQFPSGSTMSIQRRLELIRYAGSRDCFIVEDDYDSEFRFDGPPLSSLQSLAPDRVLYIGTFSKTLCPAIRIGYLVLPPELINRAREIKWRSDLHNEAISQLALAQFIKGGHYFRHIARMRHHYRTLRKKMENELKAHFGSQIELLGSATGLHLVVRFAGLKFDQLFFEHAEKRGARFYPVEMHSVIAGRHQDKILMGYGHLEKWQIEQGIAILAEMISEITKNFTPRSAERG